MKKNLILGVVLMIIGSLSLEGQETAALISLPHQNLHELEEMSMNLKEHLSTIETALQNQDNKSIGASKRDILKIVYKLNSRMTNIRQKMVHGTQNEGRLKNDRTYHEDVLLKKEQPAFATIALGVDKVEHLTYNAERMDHIMNVLKQSRFALHPHQEASGDNLEMLQEFSTLADQSLSSIKESIKS